MRNESMAKFQPVIWMDTIMCPHCELEFSIHTLDEEIGVLTPYMAFFCPNCGKEVA